MKEMDEKSVPEDFGSDIDAGDEETNEAEGFANQLALVQTLKDRVQEIDDALDRVAAGTYGICVKCGSEISKEILDLAPESALCEECKKKA